MLTSSFQLGGKLVLKLQYTGKILTYNRALKTVRVYRITMGRV